MLQFRKDEEASRPYHHSGPNPRELRDSTGKEKPSAEREIKASPFIFESGRGVCQH